MSHGIFIPYSGKKPKVIEIKGHRVLVFSHDQEDFDAAALQRIGADRVKALKPFDTAEECEYKLVELAKKAKADIVLTPKELDVSDAISNLNHQLPWVQ